jgi:F-type H+-transporting ATPase subunit epsilon
MAMTLHVDIVSAESEIFSGTATMVFAPAEMGEVGIAPRHAPMLTRLKPGEVRVQTDDAAEQSFFVSGGMLEVQPHVVTVLADTAIRAADLDEAQALEAKQRAEKMLSDKTADIDYAKAQAELAQSIAQLRAIRKLRENTKV